MTVNYKLTIVKFIRTPILRKREKLLLVGAIVCTQLPIKLRFDLINISF